MAMENYSLSQAAPTSVPVLAPESEVTNVSRAY